MTERKRWPNGAEWARMDALALANRGLKESQRLQGHKDIEVVQSGWKVYEVFSLIIITLGTVGPQQQKTGSSCGQQEPVNER